MVRQSTTVKITQAGARMIARLINQHGIGVEVRYKYSRIMLVEVIALAGLDDESPQRVVPLRACTVYRDTMQQLKELDATYSRNSLEIGVDT